MAGTKTEIQAFAQRWQGKGYEKGESVKFWIELQQAIGYQHVHTTLYEHHLDSGGFADVWLRDGNTIVEQKSLGVDLDKPELRQGAMKTPLDQALDYVDDLPRIEQPRFVVTCNFETFRVYDRDAWSKTLLPLHAFEFTLPELADHPEYLGFIVDSKTARLEKEKEVSIKAGDLIRDLYDRLEKKYLDPESPESKHALNVLCVRMVFCLFCEDSDLFERNAFYDYLKDIPPAYMRQALRKLFRALDTPKAERDPYDEDIKTFPYVNGGLFHDEVEIPNFDQETKDFLLEDVSAAINWSEISPTIFGGIFESTLNPETRHQAGMHYTSPENIHRVIDPLFLSGLKGEFADIQNNPDLTPRQKKNRYTNLHRKICSLTFFDPACGSGNFLTETYLCLRDLEDSILSELAQGQMGFDFGEAEGISGDRVSLGQFYGIEINDFAVSVAEVALWISRLKANGKSMMLYNRDTGDFPLKEAATIRCENSLRTDWSTVITPEQCDYIMGNPPFVGQDGKNDEQREDMRLVWGEGSDGYLDYVTAWYKKASDFFGDKPNGRFSFVSTNSICQGQPVAALFKPLFEAGWRISYAWPSFVWKSDATDPANVHVVIVGMDRKNGTAFLFNDEGCRVVGNINPYLADAPTFFIDKLSKPLSPELKPAVYGSKPADGGFLQIKTEQEHDRALGDPIAARFVRRSLGATELINGKKRWCLWLEDASEDDIRASAYLSEKVNGCREWRSAQTVTGDAYQLRDVPHLFRPNEKRPRGKYLCLPCHFSGGREYFTADYVIDGAIATNACFMMEDEDGLGFAILSSSAFMLWQNTVGGRLKSDCRFANTLVWNTFPVPEMTDEQRRDVIEAGKGVLEARSSYEGSSLADLYNPERFYGFDRLVEAHDKLNKAVLNALGLEPDADEGEIATRLVELYAEETEGD